MHVLSTKKSVGTEEVDWLFYGKKLSNRHL